MPVLQSESAKVSGSISVMSSDAQELLTESTWPAFSDVMSVNVLLQKSKNQFVLVFLASSGVWRMQPRSDMCFVYCYRGKYVTLTVTRALTFFC